MIKNKEITECLCFNNSNITCAFKQKTAKLYAKEERLLNILKEIKEIAENIVEKDVYENSDAKAQNIINKINEVLNV